MMRLIEQGKVDLRAPVRNYLPDFRVQDENVSRTVTIWNLLTHTSGWEGQVAGPDCTAVVVTEQRLITSTAVREADESAGSRPTQAPVGDVFSGAV
jgi:CubicO group peptidase (beta-lactamase class C family)